MVLVLLYANGIREAISCVPGDVLTLRNLLGYSMKAVADFFEPLDLFNDGSQD